MKTVLIAVAFVILIAIVTGRRYCRPKDRCWPRTENIFRLSKSITGQLLQASDPQYSLYTQMEDSYFDKNPGMIVLVKNAADVIKCMRFAKRYHIRLTVLSCGHELNGRSTADGSLQINFSNMNRVSVHLNDSKSRTGSSVRIDPGADWITIYKTVDAYKKQVAGAAATSVCVSGYSLGGGTGVVTRSYGLGVDNIIDFTIILQNGVIARCSAAGTTYRKYRRIWRSTSSRLFWAVRGSGGATFGIVMVFRYVLHDAPKGLVGYRVQYPNDINGNTTIGQEVLDFLWSYMPTLPNTWGGHVLLGPVRGPPASYRTTITINIVLNAPWSSPDLDAIRDLVDFKPSSQISSAFTNYSSMYHHQNTVRHPSHVRILNANANVKTSSRKSDLVTYLTTDAITSKFVGAIAGCTIAFLGGKMNQFPPRSAAITRDFRYTDFSITAWRVWSNTSLDNDIRNEVKMLDSKIAKFGRSCYFNDGAYDARKWKKRFWDENYGKLCRLKFKYDPHQFFYCRRCVKPCKRRRYRYKKRH